MHKPPLFDPQPCIAIVWPPPPLLSPPQSPICATAAQPPIPELQLAELLQRHQSYAKAHPLDVTKPLHATVGPVVLQCHLQQSGAEAKILLADSTHGGVCSPPPPPRWVGSDEPCCLVVAKARRRQSGTMNAMGTVMATKTQMMTTTTTMGVLVMVGRCNGDLNLDFMYIHIVPM